MTDMNTTAADVAVDAADGLRVPGSIDRVLMADVIRTDDCDYGARNPLEHEVNTLSEAQVATSKVKGRPGWHAPLLDLDHGAELVTLADGRTAVRVGFAKGGMPISLFLDLEQAATESSLPANVVQMQPVEGSGPDRVDLLFTHPVHLISSSRPGHHHLYVDQIVDDRTMETLLCALATYEVVERGFVSDFVNSPPDGVNRFVCVRLPWVRKPEPMLVFADTDNAGDPPF